jgi:glycosyltransferase involved in cell wall biosynthesis
MAGKGGNGIAEAAVNKQSRPVLIASERTAGEYAVFLHHLSVGLADESISAMLVYPPDLDVEAVISPSVEVVRHPAINLPLMGHKNRKILIETLAEFKPTVLHCLCETRAQLARFASGRLNLPYIQMVNSLRSRTGRLTFSPKRCVRIITPTASIKANLTNIYPKFAERIEQINIGSFVEKRIVCFSKPSRVRSIVTVCPWDDTVGFVNLFKAAKRLLLDEYDFMLVVMSEESEEKEMRKLLAEFELSQAVVSVPRLKPHRAVLAGGDIFIQPGPRKAFDIMLLEAMSAGTVVAGCRGGVDDLIIEGQTAAVFDPKDELSIYKTLKDLLDRPDLARQLAKSAQDYLKKNHTVSNMISSTLAVYRQAQMLPLSVGNS